VAWHHGASAGQERGQAEEGLLFQPLNEGGVAQPQADGSGVVPACKGRSDSVLPCGRRVLRFHWHWWGVSMAFSRKDMRHLSHALAIAGIIGAKKLVWQAAAALGVGAESASDSGSDGRRSTRKKTQRAVRPVRSRT
jgi:hypothetical protein